MELVEFFNTRVIPVGLWAAMLGLGLSLTPRDIRRIFAAPKAVTIGTLAQHAALPLLAFAIAVAFAPTPAIAVGVMILAACPGGLTSNAYSFAARADVALSVSLTVVSSFVTLVTLPLIIYFALDWFLAAGTAPQLSPWRTFSTLVTLTILPVGFGMLLRHLWPERVKALIETVRIATFVFLILLIVVGTIVSLEELRANFGEIVLVAGSLNVLSMLLGLGLGWAFKLPVPQRVAITFDIGIQNIALASVIVLSVLGRPEFYAVILVYQLLMKAGAVTFVFIAQRWLRRDAAPSELLKAQGRSAKSTA